jgi:hypothetical protein
MSLRSASRSGDCALAKWVIDKQTRTFKQKYLAAVFIFQNGSLPEKVGDW